MHADKHESLLQNDSMILMKMIRHFQSSQNSKFSMSLRYLKKELRDEVHYFHADKQNIIILLQVAFQHFGLGIKVSYRVILSLLMGLIQHCQSSQSNKYGISWQYLKKEVMNGVHFLHADKHQSSYNLALSFLMEVARHVQSIQNRKSVMFLQYIKVNESRYRRCGVTPHFPKTKK